MISISILGLDIVSPLIINIEFSSNVELREVNNSRITLFVQVSEFTYEFRSRRGCGQGSRESSERELVNKLSSVYEEATFFELCLFFGVSIRSHDIRLGILNLRHVTLGD